MMPDYRLILGDCVERMAELPADSVDLILTSPPYDNLRKYARGSAFDFAGLADQCVRTLKPGGVLVWVVGDETKDGDESGTSFRQALHFKSLGLRLYDTMVYHKANVRPQNHRRYNSAFEFMFVFSSGAPKTFNPIVEPCKRACRRFVGTFRKPDGRLVRCFGNGRPVKPTKVKSNIWAYGVGGRDHGHPAIFPLQLATDHILSWTDPGDLVVDPFVGSGTTLEACLKTGRYGIGIDISPEYLAIAERRIAADLEAA